MIEVIARRAFLKQSAQAVAAAGLTVAAGESVLGAKQLFKISLAQWSLHKALFKKELDNLDFAKKAKLDFGISAVEYVNQFFKDKAKDKTYLAATYGKKTGQSQRERILHQIQIAQRDKQRCAQTSHSRRSRRLFAGIAPKTARRLPPVHLFFIQNSVNSCLLITF